MAELHNHIQETPVSLPFHFDHFLSIHHPYSKEIEEMGWEVRLSNSRGVPYFYDPETKDSTWKLPPGMTEEQANQLPGAEYLSAPKVPEGQVRASHLLVKHSGSRRPSSWKEADITRSKEEAVKILQGYQTEIGGSAETFAKLAAVHSDCSSHAKNGDLGFFGHGQMQKPFEEAAYSLEVGQISDIISTDSGVHLVMRTA
ncbi:hypothetical protein D9757_008415 [Collybiopsis confluens]|uniref:Peptidyl-prolyl cis-trans isomerase n=1 Tax=Collybiopsis confluens TaxID=2823264 RepID=A0A8H5HHR1_9AGAR|nr:hypothetical protein D9757_008415 [Collybiopsis confluens]